MSRTIVVSMVAFALLLLGVLGIVALLAPSESVSAQPTCSAASYWELEETSSEPPYADTQGGNDGTACEGGNCPSPTIEGKVGAAQIFDSSTGINIPASTDFDWAADDSFSIAFWMQGNDQTCTGTNNEVVIGREGTESGNNVRWWLGCRGPNDAANQGKAYFQLRSKNNQNVALFSDDPVNDGEWHHIVGVRDESTDTTYLYVDGQEVDSEVVDYSEGFDTGAGLNLGWLNLTSGDFNFKGTIDEVAIFNEALSPGAIQSYYAYGYPGGEEAGLGYCAIENATAGLSVSNAADPDVVFAGQNTDVTYTYTVSNTGDVAIADIEIDSNNDTCDVTGPPASGDDDSDGRLDPEEIWTYTCTETVTEDTTNSVTATGTIPASIGGVVSPVTSGPAEATVDFVTSALAVTKSVDQTTVRAGETVNFTYIVTNTGSDDLTEVTVTDDACSPITSSDSGPLTAGTDRTFTCSTTVNEDISSAATANATSASGPVSGQSDEVAVDVFNSALEITLAVDKNAIEPGETVMYSYTVDNTGDDPLTNVTVSHSVCSPITQTGGDTNSDEILDPDETWTYTCSVAPNSGSNSTATAEGTDSTSTVVSDESDAVTVSVGGDVPGNALYLPIVLR